MITTFGKNKEPDKLANRPVFIPIFEGDSFYEEKDVEFHWHAGMAISQKRKSIQELHQATKTSLNLWPILEISTKSPVNLGVSLSAFNLQVDIKNSDAKSTVENVFQASKVFENGGPYLDLLSIAPFKAKSDPRLENSGQLVQFEYENIVWPTNKRPLSLFYDWIYIEALTKFPERVKKLSRYNAFTDIEYNPKKSMSCQARSVSILSSIMTRGLENKILTSFETFRNEMLLRHSNYQQLELFLKK